MPDAPAPGPLAHICLVVHDLEAALETWTSILTVLDPAQVQAPPVRYEGFESGTDNVRAVTFAAPGGTQIQLSEPAPGTPLAQRLAEHGEHVHHICFTADDVPAAAEALASAGVEADAETMYSDPATPWQEWTWIRRRAAHGVAVEISRPYRIVDGAFAPPASADRPSDTTTGSG